MKLWRSSRSCKPSQSLETCFMIIRTLPTPLNLHVLVAPWCIPLSEPWPLTPVGHMHLFTLYSIIKAISPMSLIASRWPPATCFVVYCISPSLYYLLEIKVILLLLPDTYTPILDVLRRKAKWPIVFYPRSLSIFTCNLRPLVIIDIDPTGGLQ